MVHASLKLRCAIAGICVHCQTLVLGATKSGVPRPIHVIRDVLPFQVEAAAKEGRVIVVGHDSIGRIGCAREHAGVACVVTALPVSRKTLTALPFHVVNHVVPSLGSSVRPPMPVALYGPGERAAPSESNTAERRVLTPQRHARGNAVHVIEVTRLRVNEIPMPDRHTRPIAQRNTPHVVVAGLVPEAATDD